MRRLEERNALLQQPVDVHLPGLHRRLRGELRERADAPLQRFDFVHHNLRCLLHEAAVGLVVAYQHLFHGQPDRRQRVLHLVRHLARRSSISSTVSRIGVSEFFTSCAIWRADPASLPRSAGSASASSSPRAPSCAPASASSPVAASTPAAPCSPEAGPPYC